MTQTKTAQGRIRHRERVIAALLSTNTIADAARQSSVSVPTIKRWLATPDFQNELKAARSKFLSDTMAATTKALVEASMGSVDVLKTIANSGAANEASRVAAAKSILDFAIRTGMIAEIDNRLAAIEAGSSDENQ